MNDRDRPNHLSRQPRCRKCGGTMSDGVAMESTLVAGVPDFPGEDFGVTMSPGGPGRVVKVTKCEDCGHSFTK